MVAGKPERYIPTIDSSRALDPGALYPTRRGGVTVGPAARRKRQALLKARVYERIAE
jgi:hypothetical protein